MWRTHLVLKYTLLYAPYNFIIFIILSTEISHVFDRLRLSLNTPIGMDVMLIVALLRSSLNVRMHRTQLTRRNTVVSLIYLLYHVIFFVI